MSNIFQRAYQIQSQVEDELLAKRNVVGVAVGYKNADTNPTDEPAVVALVEEKLPPAALSADDMVPTEIAGVTTDVYEVGFLRAQQAQNPKAHFRPQIPGGVSIGHYKITAGTLGVMVKDRTTGERFILSNNHVLANSNEAFKGDAILQPGPMDGGQNPADRVATLERFIELIYLEGPVTPDPDPDTEPNPGNPPGGSGCDVVELLVSLSNLLASLTGSNKRVQTTSKQLAQKTPSTASPTRVSTQQLSNVVDAALARPVDPNMFLDEILTIGTITGASAPGLGMRVRKFGRTTSYTEGNVTLVNATVNVNYSTSAGPRTARFTGQVITEAMSQGGDSGSLVVEVGSQNAVGLLFAGSPLATIFSPISSVMNALNIEF